MQGVFGTRARVARWAALGGLGTAGFLSGCGGNASDAAPTPMRPPTPVQVETIQRVPFAETLTVPGIVEAESRIALGFRINGFIARFAVDEGDRVDAGTVIAELDLADLERAVRLARAAVERANAHAAEAKLLFDRQEDLLKSGNTSQQTFDQARLAWEAAHAASTDAAVQLETAEDHLAKGTLRAPVTGYIERRHAEAHEPARSGQPIVTLTVLDTVTVRAAVADTDRAKLQIGGAVTISSPAAPDRTYTGTIARIDMAADAVTRTCPFEATVPNPDLALRPEMVVETQVALGETEPQCTVPLNAVLRDAAAEPFCFVIGGGEHATAERRPIACGAVHGSRICVAQGLQEGERVVTRGQHFLSDGDPIRILEP